MNHGEPLSLPMHPNPGLGVNAKSPLQGVDSGAAVPLPTDNSGAGPVQDAGIMTFNLSAERHRAVWRQSCLRSLAATTLFFARWPDILHQGRD